MLNCLDSLLWRVARYTSGEAVTSQSTPHRQSTLETPPQSFRLASSSGRKQEQAEGSILFLSSGESRGTRAESCLVSLLWRVASNASGEAMRSRLAMRRQAALATPPQSFRLTVFRASSTQYQTKHFFALRCPGVNLRSFACACCFMRSEDPAELLFPKYFLYSHTKSHHIDPSIPSRS